MTVRTVLITGGAGFIGTAVAQRLAATADRWVVLDSLHPQVHPSGERPRSLPEAAELVHADVTDPAAWDALLADVRPTTVLHLAAETGTAQSLHEATRHAHVNVVGTTAMLDALGRADQVPEHLVLSSSRAVYGEGQWRHENGTISSPGMRGHQQLAAGLWDLPDAVSLASTAQGTPPAPTSIYGATKLAQEHLLRAWAGAHDTALTVLRLQNVYGPGQSLINAYTGIVSLFSQWAEQGRSIPVYEDGGITRDFVYIADVADAIATVMTTGPELDGEILDVGSGARTTILELAGIIARHHGAPEPHVTGAFRDGDVRHAHTDITHTLERLDWRPQWSLVAGVEALQGWIAEQSERHVDA